MVDQYCEDGDYVLSSIDLYDASERKNGAYFSYSANNHTLYPIYAWQGAPEKVVLEKAVELSVTQSGDYKNVEIDSNIRPGGQYPVTETSMQTGR